MADESIETEESFNASGDIAQNGDELNASNQTDDMDDPDLEMIKARVKEMEEEAEKIKQMQNEVEKMAHSSSGILSLSFEDKMEIDARSIYVGNVDYGATAEELEQHFHGCGSINRVTIQCDKYSGHPKGFAYIEFADKDSVSTAAALDESLFRGRQIKVLPKRTNRPGISTTNRAPRGGRFRRSSRISYYTGYRPMRRSMRRRNGQQKMKKVASHDCGLDGLESDSKMMIYKIHQLRILVAAILLATLTVLLVILNPPQKCVQVSVSVREWRPHHMKRTRVVQGLEETVIAANPESKYLISLPESDSFSSAWFRTKLVSSSPENNEQKDTEDEERDEPDTDDYSETNDNYSENEYYDDLPANKVFEDGDFDYNDTEKYGSKFLEPDFGVISRIFFMYSNGSDNSSGTTSRVQSSQTKQSLPYLSKNYRKSLSHKWRNITLINIEGVPIVEDGIFWSDELEKRAPKGATDEEAQSVLKKLRSLNVQRVEPPTWNRCGRPKNQFIVFEDGSKACARYRAPHQYLVQGEILSFYLSRLLGINNVPVVSLAAVRPNFQGMWSRQSVKEDLIAAKWEVNTTVALIQWIENLERDKMPRILLTSLEDKGSLSASSPDILKLPAKKLTELLQWSDLIVFDYITGNYDRVASMQDAADKEGKPSILQETVHNLVRSKSTGGLWLIDNESGLLDSYSLLYGTAGKDGRFVNFHKQMLNTLCLFRRHTVERIRRLHESNKAGPILMEVVKQLEPLFTPVKREKEVGKRLQQRIAEVHAHIEQCLTSLS